MDQQRPDQTSACADPRLTGLHRAVDVILGLVVDPVEPSLHRQLGQEAVLLRLPVVGGDVHGPAFVVQRARGVVPVLVPGLCHSQVHPWPLVHHSQGQAVQTVLTSLRKQRTRAGTIGIVLEMNSSVAQIQFFTTVHYMTLFKHTLVTGFWTLMSLMLIEQIVLNDFSLG